MCLFESCNKKPVAHGLCRSHYRQHMQGESLRAIRIKAKDGQSHCAVAGCDNKSCGKFCQMHRKQMKKFGRITNIKSSAKSRHVGEVWISSQGYKFIKVEGRRHPKTFARHVFEGVIGRELRSYETVKFKDGNPLNCRKENLYLVINGLRVTKECPRCGAEFCVGPSNDKRYCSRDCRPVNKYTNEQVRRILSLANDGMSRPLVARKLKIPLNYVHMVCSGRVRNSTPIPPPERSVSDDIARDVIKMVLAGKRNCEIVKELSVSKYLVQDIKRGRSFTWVSGGRLDVPKHRTCQCGSEFTPKRNNQGYCSKECVRVFVNRRRLARKQARD